MMIETPRVLPESNEPDPGVGDVFMHTGIDISYQTKKEKN